MVTVALLAKLTTAEHRGRWELMQSMAPDGVETRLVDPNLSRGELIEALKGVDLGIREGEILALLGPNGAGKTTLISAICGIVTPTSGSIEVDGQVADATVLAVGQLTRERQHPVPSIRDLAIDLLLGRCLELSATQARHDRPVFQCFSVALRAVANGTVLAKEGRLI